MKKITIAEQIEEVEKMIEAGKIADAKALLKELLQRRISWNQTVKVNDLIARLPRDPRNDDKRPKFQKR